MRIFKISFSMLACLGSCLIVSNSVFAAARYWDLNTTTAGAGATPTGTWDTGTSNWATDAAGTSASTTFANNDDVYFAAGTDATNNYTVTVSGGVTVNSINVEADGGADVTITGGSGISLFATTTTIDVASSRTLTIASQIVGSNNLSKSSAGNLIVSGANTYSGSTAVTAGTMFVASGGSLATGTGTTVSASAILGGEGTLNGNMTLATDGIVSAGDAANDIGSLALNGTNDFTNGVYYFEINDAEGATAGTDYDEITSTGTIDFAGLSGNALTIKIRNVTSGFYTSVMIFGLILLVGQGFFHRFKRAKN